MKINIKVTICIALLSMLYQNKFLAQKDETTENINMFVDEDAYFPGGYSGLMQFISNNYIYPNYAKEKQLEGKFFVKFAVNTDGSVSHVSIDQKMNPPCRICEDEGIRVVKLMSGWTPAKIDDKNVASWYIIPISLSASK
jgi:protein TonB